MFIPSTTDAPAPTVPSTTTNTLTYAPPPSSTTAQEPVTHMLFGTLSAVQATIRLLYRLNYAEPNDWSQPMSTGRPNEVMVILTRRVKVGQLVQHSHNLVRQRVSVEQGCNCTILLFSRLLVRCAYRKQAKLPCRRNQKAMPENPLDDKSKDTIKRLFAGNPITAGDVERMLKQLGATLKKKRGKGSHRRWQLPNGMKATIPGKASSDLRYDVCKSLKTQLTANNVNPDGGIEDD